MLTYGPYSYFLVFLYAYLGSLFLFLGVSLCLLRVLIPISWCFSMLT